MNLRLIKHGGRILLSPRIVCKYFARDSLAKLWRMYYQYGYFKPLVVRKVGGVMTLRQLAPPLFVLGLAVTALAGCRAWRCCLSVELVAPAAFALVAGGYLLAIGACAAASGPQAWPGRGRRAAGSLSRLALELWIGYLRGVVEFLVLRRKRAAADTAQDQFRTDPRG